MRDVLDFWYRPERAPFLKVLVHLVHGLLRKLPLRLVLHLRRVVLEVVLIELGDL